MTIRKFTTIYPANKNIDDGDMLLWRALPLFQRKSLGPFVFIDHYQHQSNRGIGDRPHPHAGIEVISYILQGSVEHRDSFGFRDKLNAGDAQWICAGRGIIHAEQPLGGRHGLQLWTSLPPSKKMLEPHYRSFHQAEIPLLEKNGAQIRVVTGTVDNITGPMETISHTVMAYVKLPADTTLKLAIDAEELGIYVTKGKLPINANYLLGSEGLAILSEGDEIEVHSGNDAVEFAILGGEKAEGPILFDGPFVMDTQERLIQAYRDYHGGKMGILE
ncbi:pirin family protein [[Pasteurella] aerogenes]